MTSVKRKSKTLRGIFHDMLYTILLTIINFRFIGTWFIKILPLSRKKGVSAKMISAGSENQHSTKENVCIYSWDSNEQTRRKEFLIKFAFGWKKWHLNFIIWEVYISDFCVMCTCSTRTCQKVYHFCSYSKTCFKSWYFGK